MPKAARCNATWKSRAGCASASDCESDCAPAAWPLLIESDSAATAKLTSSSSSCPLKERQYSKRASYRLCHALVSAGQTAKELFAPERHSIQSSASKHGASA